MKKYVKRLMSCLLVVSLILSVMVVPAGATSVWSSFKNALADMFFASYGVEVSSDDIPDFTFTKVGSVTPEELDQQCGYYNSVFGSWLRDYSVLAAPFSGHAMAKPDYDLNITRPMDMKTGEWIVDGNGNYPYYNGIGDVGAIEAPPSDPYVNAWWLPSELSSVVKPMNYSELEDLGKSLSAGGHECRLVSTLLFGTRCWVIQDYSTDGGANRIYGDLDAQAYVSYDQPSATDNKYDYIVNDNSIAVNDSQIIDIENGTLNLIDDNGDKIGLNIESLIFDTGDKSYTINAYDTTYEGDTAYYTYYTYNITYNITNTYVTYIGSNDAYEKEEYEYYYQLPDGRSSADLTADEIAGMSFEFHDVVNYAKSATDTYLRALYHFDGNTDDSSYFSTQGKFEWTQGASITYMEAPEAFDGALYLDNTAHSFDIMLPSNLASGDFSLQFRYYQASEPDTEDNIDNFIEIDGIKVLCWDEKTVSRDPEGKYATWALPIGTWNEISVIRHSGILYVYLNGLCVSQEANASVLGDIITFSLGSGSRAYSMIDELRVINFAYAENGESYTCTAVPYDTNSVLVLPGSAFPIADEYWDISSSGTNLLTSYGMDAFYDGQNATSSYFKKNPGVLSPYSFSDYYGYTGVAVDGRYTGTGTTTAVYPNFVRFNRYTDITFSDDGFLLDTSNFPTDFALDHVAADYINQIFGGAYADCLQGTILSSGLFSTVAAYKSSGAAYYLPAGTYTFSLVDSNADMSSVSFEIPSTLTEPCLSGDKFGEAYLSSGAVASAWVGDYEFGLYRTFATTSGVANTYYPVYSLFIRPVSREVPSSGIVYVELVEGSSTDLTAEWVTCMYSSEEVKPNTAAIQTDISVNGYTVGGVRPTFPARGDVWFPVQENRITACYIYTGSMWKEVGCRWYTGSRWIPIYAFDLTTLEDLFDIADASTAVPPITSESAFWRWWQLQWLDFREYLDGKFDELIAAITGGSVGSDADITVPDEEGNSKFSFSDLVGVILSSLLEIATTVLTEFIGLIADMIKMFIQAVMDFIGGFVGVLSDATGHIATLGDNVAPIGEFVRGVYGAIPDPIEDVLTGSFVVVVVVSVISFLL